MSDLPPDKHVIIIGGGPAGLMAADVLSQAGTQVDLFDSKPSVGRKFLIAGIGGLNLTHSEPHGDFLSRYGSSLQYLEPHLEKFGPPEIRDWAAGLGIETFIGTSGRVFPADMKAAPLLYAWRQRLSKNGVSFHYRHQWTGWNTSGDLQFDTPAGVLNTNAQAVILAMGGGSWKKTGSTGEWAAYLAQKGLSIAPFKPANCGFDIHWSDHFRTKFDGQPVKTVSVTFTPAGKNNVTKQGEFIISEHGVEGSLIYAFSAPIRDEIDTSGHAVIYLDLCPDRSREAVAQRLGENRGSRSASTHIEKSLGIKGVKTGLLWEYVPRDDFNYPEKLAGWIKNLPLKLTAPRPLDEAISSAGGLMFSEIDQGLMIKKMPGYFCAGEMLDWEAPTGGYMITACVSTGYAAAEAVLKWLNKNSS